MNVVKVDRQQLLIPILLILAVGVAWLVLPGSRPALTALTLNIVFVVGLSIFVSNTGILSFGHATFVAVGAYLAGLLAMPVASKSILLPNLPQVLGQAELPLPIAALVAAAFAAVLAVVIGAPLMKLSGVAASIATLSLLVIANVVLSNWSSVTGGTGTLTGVPSYTTFGVGLVAALASVGVAYLFHRSRTGRLLRATREDLTAARSLGIRPVKHRLIALGLSAFVMGVGGGLYGSYLGSFSPDAFYLQLTFMLLAMTVVGGRFSLGGVVLGACMVSAITEFFRTLEAGVWIGSSEIAVRPGLGGVLLAVLVVVVLTLRPDGVLAGSTRPGRRGRRRDRQVSAEEAAPVEVTA